ncbi:hypothetical protein N7U68_05270 [Roseovarius pelagicus]|uniref:Uncharacterized protein n=1 Tax=Roseovarius pelagicus TaxID=2980108 RepID=A0ABY6DD42_9RHOB|nr:hypothetical protein N7U68_05270 [Roseovarius pelagicus]
MGRINRLRISLFEVIDAVDPRSFATSYTQSRAIAATPGTKDEEDDEEQGFALALSMNAFNTDDKVDAIIRFGADVTSGSLTNILAKISGDFIHLVNLPSEVPGTEDPVSDAIGGAVSFSRAAATTNAIIEDDAKVAADGVVTISSQANVNQSLFTYAGGGGNNRSINGSLALGISQGTTTARVGGAADLTGSLITLNAVDDSMLLNIGGALSASENLSVGATGVINFTDRDIYAGVGPGAKEGAPVTGTSGNTAVSARTLNINATNNSADIAIAVAGAKTTASDDQDAALADFLLSDDEFAKLLSQDDNEAPGEGDPQADAGSGKPRTGWAVAGAAAINLALGNKVRAEINTPATVEAIGGVIINARNTSTVAAATGAVAVGLSNRQDVNALAGAFSILVDDRNVTARIAKADIDAGVLAIKATDDATVVNIAIGGAGNKRGSKAVAGSVAVATLDGETNALIEDADLTIGGEAKFEATDTSLTVSIAGAAGLNFSKNASSASGVGIGIAVNTVMRPAKVILDPSSRVTAGSFVANSLTDDSIYAFAISAGLGKTAFSGSITVNTVIGGAQTEIGKRGVGVSNMRITTDSVNVTAKESTSILAAGGALSVARSGGNALGGAVVINTVKNASHAKLEDTTISARTAGPGAAVPLTATATADTEIRAYSVAAAGSTKKYAGALGASSNVIDSTINLSLAGATFFSGGVITLSATNNRFIQSLSGGVGISGNGAGGAALALNLMLGNDAKITLTDALLQGRGPITINASATGEIQSLAAGIALADDSAIGISAAANVTTGTTGIDATGAILNAEGAPGTLSLMATDTSTIKAFSGGAALSLSADGAGAALSVNVIGNTTSIEANGGRFFADGTATFAADNTATIKALAVGLGFARENSLAGSIVVGHSSATTKVDLKPSELGVSGIVTVRAKQTSDLDLLTGALAIGGDNAVGAAVTAAIINNTVTADLEAGRLTDKGEITVFASDDGSIEAKALGGAAALDDGGAASIVVAKIGTKPDDADAQPELEGEQPGDAKPIAAGGAAGDKAQNDAIAAALNVIAQSSVAEAKTVQIEPTTPRNDTLRARVKVTNGEIDNQGFSVRANRSSTIDSVAGVVSLTGENSAGLGLGLNFIYGTTTSELLLPVTTGTDTHLVRKMLVRADEFDTINGTAIAGALGGDNGGAGGLVFNDIKRVTDVTVGSAVLGQRAAVQLATRDANIGYFGMRTQDATAGVIGAGGENGGGAAIAVNRNGDRMTTTLRDLKIDGRERDAAGDLLPVSPSGATFVSLAAEHGVNQDALALSLGGAAKIGLAGSFGINILSGKSNIVVNNVDAEVEGFGVNGFEFTRQDVDAGGVALAGKAGIGVGIAVNKNTHTLQSDVTGSRIVTRGAYDTLLLRSSGFGAVAIAGAIGGKVAITGSAATNKLSAKTLSNVSDSTIIAGNIARLGAAASSRINANGGAGDGRAVNGSFAVGGKVGIGASVTVNDTASTVDVTIKGSNITALGLGADTGSVFGGDGTRHDGVLIEADILSNIDMITVTGGAALLAGIGANYVYTSVADKASVNLGSDTASDEVKIGAAPDARARSFIMVNENAKTASARIASYTNTTINNQAYGVGLGAVGGGLTVASTFIATDALVNLGRTDVKSGAGSITLAADVDNKIDLTAVGVAGGGAALAGAVGVTEVTSNAIIALKGSTLETKGTSGFVGLDATSTNVFKSVGGTGAAAGSLAGAGVVVVTTLGGKTEVTLDKSGTRASGITSKSDLVIVADAANTLTTTAIGAAAGAQAGLALSANVTKGETQVELRIGEGSKLDVNGDARLFATVAMTLNSISGAGGIGGAAAGGALDYIALAQAAKIEIADDAQVIAGGNVQLNATSTDMITAHAASVAAGGFSLAGALAIADIGGRTESDDDTAKLTTAAVDAAKADQSETVKEADEDGNPVAATDEEKQNSAANIAAMGGGADTRAKSNATQQKVALGTTGDISGARIKIGDDAVLNSGLSLSVFALANTGLSQIGGAGSLSLGAGASTGTVKATVGTDALITVGDNTALVGADQVSLSATIGGLIEPDEKQKAVGEGKAIIDAEAYTGGAAGIAAASAGVVVAGMTGDAKVMLGQGVLMGDRTLIDNTLSASNPSINLDAARSGAVRAYVFNLSLSAGLTVGTAVSHADIAGTSAIEFNNSSASVIFTKGNVSLAASDDTRADAQAVSSSGGILNGNGVDVRASNTGNGTIALDKVTIVADDLTVRNQSRASSYAKAKGISGGLATVGASVARSTTKVDLATTIGSGASAQGDIEITSRFLPSEVKKFQPDAVPEGESANTLVENAAAFAVSSAGGLLAGNGADAATVLDYDVSTTVGGTLVGESIVATGEAGATAVADATGKQGGLAAIGVVLTKLTAPRANVTVNTNDGALFVAADEMALTATNQPMFDLLATSGSGGLVSGAGAGGTLDVKSKTLLSIGKGTYFADSLRIQSESDIGLGSTVDSVNASLVGASGANMDTDVTSRVDTKIAANAGLFANSLQIGAINKIARPEDGFNVVSGSGGALDVAAMDSDVALTIDTLVDIGDNAALRQIDTATVDDTFVIEALSDITLIDRQSLDSGGAIVLPFGNSSIKVTSTDADIKLGKAKLTALSDLVLRTGGDADIRSEVFSNTYGLAGAASATALAEYEINHGILIDPEAEILTEGNLSLLAGFVGEREQIINVVAEGRAFNRTAVPFSTDPTATATANTRSDVVIGEDSSLRAAGDVDIFAVAGDRTVRGYALGKDFYREAAAEVGTFFNSTIGGGDPVSLDVEIDDSNDVSTNLIELNGLVRAGNRNQRALILDENGKLDNASFGYSDELADGINFEIGAQTSLKFRLDTRIDELRPLVSAAEARIAGIPGASLNRIETRQKAELTNLLERKARAQNVRGALITVEDVTAREGNIDLRADMVSGSTGGKLVAPGDALIDIRTAQASFLVVKDLTISGLDGGIITFNDVRVESAADIVAQARATNPFNIPITLLPANYEVESATDTDPPVINVSTTNSVGFVTVEGEISNLRGVARVVSNQSDIDIRGSVSALTPILAAPNGDFTLTATETLAHIGPDPVARYRDFFNSVALQSAEIAIDENGFNIIGGESRLTFDSHDNDDFTFSRAYDAGAFDRVTSANAVDPGARIQGANVFITADVINIAGAIEAGVVGHAARIAEGLDADIAALEASGATGRKLLFTPVLPGDVVADNSPFIQATVPVFYNLDKDRIEIDDMITRGGQVTIVGKIASTGFGSIEAFDGFGAVTVDSNVRTPVMFGRVDTGGSTEPGQGVEGLVRITDLNRTNSKGAFLTTEYRRGVDADGSQVLRVFDNEQTTVVTDASGNSLAQPSRLVQQITADGARKATYTPIKQAFFFNQLREVKFGENIANAKLSAPENSSFISEPIFTTESDYGVLTSNFALLDLTQPGVNGFPGKIIGDEIFTRHVLKADLPIDILFRGLDRGDVDIDLQGDLLLSDLVRNSTGRTLLVSDLGSLSALNDKVTIVAKELVIGAGRGTVLGASNNALRTNLVPDGTLSVFGRDVVKIHEIAGDMLLESAVSLDSDTGDGSLLELTAAGSILGEKDDANVIIGGDIFLAAGGGRIGGTNGVTRLTVVNTGGAITATAEGDIALTARQGDLNLRDVQSRTGNIQLTVSDGSILDANPIEREDLRTQGELIDLWAGDLALIEGTDSAAARVARQIDGLQAAEQARYVAFWRARKAGKPTDTASLDADSAAVRQRLQANAGDASTLEAFDAQLATLRAEWDAQTDFDPNFQARIPEVLRAEVLADATWTQNELERFVDAGLVRRSAATQIRDEDPNIRAAGDIVLFATKDIGTGLAPLRILGADDDALSTADLAALGAAEVGDIFFDQGNTFVARRDDLNLASTAFDGDVPVGSVVALAGGQNMLLGARTPLQIAAAASSGLTLIKAEGNLTQTDSIFNVAVAGAQVVLEAGRDGSIGTVTTSVEVEITDGGSFDARAGAGIFVAAPEGDLPVASVFSGGDIRLTVLENLTDARPTGAPRIIGSGTLSLTARNIGASDAPIRFELPGDARVVLATGQDAFAETKDDLTLLATSLGGGGRIVSAGAIRVVEDGARTGVIDFGTQSTLTVVAADGLTGTRLGGPDVQGGTLKLTTGGDVGGAFGPLSTALTGFSYTSTGSADAPTSLSISEADNLTISSLTQTAGEGLVTRITLPGDLAIGRITSAQPVDIFMPSGRILGAGSIRAPEVTLVAPGGIGTVAPVPLETDLITARSFGGAINLALNSSFSAPAIGLGDIRTGGDHGLTLTAGNTPVLLARGGALTTIGGDLKLTTGGDFSFSENTFGVQSVNGRVDLMIGGNATLGRVSAGSGLGVTVAKTLTGVPGLEGPMLVTTQAAAVTRLRATDIPGDVLQTQISALDVAITNKNLNVQNTGNLDLVGMSATGDVTIGVDGILRLGTLQTGGRIDLTADAIAEGDTTITATLLKMTTTKGSIGGVDGLTGRFRVSDGAISLSAETDIHVAQLGADFLLRGVVAKGRVQLIAGAGDLRAANISGADIALSAFGDIQGLTGPLAVKTGSFSAGSFAGDINVEFAATPVVVLTQVEAGRDGNIALRQPGGLLRVASGGAVKSIGGDVTLTAASVEIDGTVQTATGSIVLLSQNNIDVSDPNARVDGGFGTLRFDAGSDLILGTVTSAANDDAAMTLIAGGTLRRAIAGRPTRLIAQNGGAVVSVGTVEGAIDVDLARLSISSARSDVTVNAVTDLSITKASSGTGNVTVSGAGVLRVGEITPIPTGTTRLVATNDLFSTDETQLGGARIELQSREGAIGGAAGGAFRFAADDSTIVTARSAGDMSLRNTVGDLRLGVLESGLGGIDVTAARDLILSERVTAGKDQVLTLTATRSITGQGGFTVGRTVTLVAQNGAISDGAGGALRMEVPTTATVEMAAAQNINVALTGGDVRFGNVAAGGNVALDIEDGTLLAGQVSGAEIRLTAANGIGRDKLVTVNGGPVRAITTAGDLRLSFAGAKTARLDAALTAGTGRIELIGRGTDLTIGDRGVRGEGQSVNIDVASLTLDAGVVSQTGDISVETQRALVMRSNTTPITAMAGAATLKVGTDLTVGIVTGNASERRSIDVDVAGDLFLAPGVIGARFIGDARGSDARIRLGRSTVTGPLGFETRLRRLDIVQARGDLHLNNLNSLDLARGIAETGMLEIFAGGSLDFEFAKAADGKKLILAAGGGVHAKSGVVEADDVGIYGFGGSIDQDLFTDMTLETRDGAVVRMFARDRIAVREATGSLTIASVISDNLGVTLFAPEDLTVGLIGSGKAVSVTSGRNLTVNRVGRASVQIEDAVGLGLVRPDFYRTVLAKSPTMLDLVTENRLSVGIATASDKVNMVGRNVMAKLSDATPADGLTVGLTAPGGKFTDSAALTVIGAGPDVLLGDPLSLAASDTSGFGNNWDGTLRLDGVRVGTAAGVTELRTGASRLVVTDTRIGGDTRFIQRDFSLLAQRVFTANSDKDTVQVVTQDMSAVDFEVTNGRNLVTRNLTVLNDVTQSLTAGRTVAEIVEALVVLQADETIVAHNFVVEDEVEGTVGKVLTLRSVTIRGPRGDRIVRLPLIMASSGVPQANGAPG